MFRITGRDVRGRIRELSVYAPTEEEARALAERDGIVVIDRVSVPPPLPPSRFPKLSGFARGVLASVGCFAVILLGAAAGALIAREAELPAGPDERILNSVFFVPFALGTTITSLRGAFAGACVGLLCVVAVLFASYGRHRTPR